MRQARQSMTGYSVEEVKKQMEDYLDLSERRLRARLKEAWEKHTFVATQTYGRETTPLLRTGAR